MIATKRTYLAASPGERHEVIALGAVWDPSKDEMWEPHAKTWYPRRMAFVPPGMDLEPFQRWMPIYLNASYYEKDEVKALGADWDNVVGKWYISPSWNITEKFCRWLPSRYAPCTPTKGPHAEDLASPASAATVYASPASPAAAYASPSATTPAARSDLLSNIKREDDAGERGAVSLRGNASAHERRAACRCIIRSVCHECGCCCACCACERCKTCRNLPDDCECKRCTVCDKRCAHESCELCKDCGKYHCESCEKLLKSVVGKPRSLSLACAGAWISASDSRLELSP